MWGLHFQSNLLGGGSCLSLEGLTALEGLPFLSKTNKYFISGVFTAMVVFLLQCENLHVFYEVLGALHHHYSLKWGMLTHHTAYPVHSNDKLREGGRNSYPLFINNPSPSNMILPASTCHTSDWHCFFPDHHHAASSEPCWYHCAEACRVHPDTPHMHSSQSAPRSPGWFDLRTGTWEINLLVYNPNSLKMCKTNEST